MQLNFSVPVVALLVGAALGFCLRPAAPSEHEDETTTTKVRAPSHIAHASNDASVEVLRNRIKELEGLLASEANRATELAESMSYGEDARPLERRERFNPREMMERLKKEDPERYTHMTNQMARFRQHRTEQAQSRLDFLASIDLSALGSEAQDIHTKLQNMIARREEIEERLHSENIPDEERETIMRELFATEREMNELNRDERSNLIAETVRELGFADEDAENVIATLNDIIEVTSSHFGPPRGPGRGRGGPGGLGGGPGGPM